MTFSIQAALPTTPIPYARASPESLNTGASLGPVISWPQASGPATPSLANPAERFGLTTAGSTAEALREQAASTAANTIHWTPWQRAYSADHKWPGNWINTSA
jgi:hypothetical protein